MGRPHKSTRGSEVPSQVDTRNEVSAGGVVFRLRDGGGFDVALILTHERELARMATERGFHILDSGPLVSRAIKGRS